MDNTTADLCVCGKEMKIDKPTKDEFLPEYRTIISIPICNRHSYKPSPDEIFREFVKEKENSFKIELFARECRSGFISFGNEVINYNDAKYFLK